MQVVLAFAGGIAGIVSWWIIGHWLWLAGAVLLLSVIPITLLFIKPINVQLLSPVEPLSAERIIALLTRWNPLHGLRTIASGCTFLCYLAGLYI